MTIFILQKLSPAIEGYDVEISVHLIGYGLKRVVTYLRRCIG